MQGNLIRLAGGTPGVRQVFDASGPLSRLPGIQGLMLVGACKTLENQVCPGPLVQNK
jgi:hypothetical protein